MKLLNKEQYWSRLKNYRPNDVVNHNDKLWQNVTGLNTEPIDYSLDWVNIPDFNKGGDKALLKPEVDGNITDYPYVVMVNDEGESAKRNATEFGKVDTVMGVAPDASKNDKNVDISGVPMNWTNANHRWAALPNKSGEDTYNKVIVLGADGKAGTKDAGDLGKNFSNTDLEITENRKHTGTASVELAMPMVYSNKSQRFPGLVDKSSDATYNDLLGVDSNGYAAKVGLNAVTNAMAKSTDAQKDAWRLAQRKTNETYSTGQPIISNINPPTLDNTLLYKQVITIVGSNLYIDNSSANPTAQVYLRRVKDTEGVPIPIENIDVTSKTTSMSLLPNILTIIDDFSTYQKGYYKVVVIHNGLESAPNSEMLITDYIEEIPVKTMSVTEHVGSANYNVTGQVFNYPLQNISSAYNLGNYGNISDFPNGVIITIIVSAITNNDSNSEPASMRFAIGNSQTITQSPILKMGVLITSRGWSVDIKAIPSLNNLGSLSLGSSAREGSFELQLKIKDGIVTIYNLTRNISVVKTYSNLQELNLFAVIDSNALSNKFSAQVTQIQKL